MMPITVTARARTPSRASSSPTCGPTNSERCRVTGSVLAPLTEAWQTWRSPFSVACVLTWPASAVHSAPNTLPTSSACFIWPRSGMRMSTSREVPKFCTWTSPRCRVSTASRVLARLAAWAYCTSMSEPPVNSMEKCRPRVTRKKTAAAKVKNEMTLKTSACRMNGMSRLMRKNSMVSCSASLYSWGFQTCPMDTPLSFF